MDAVAPTKPRVALIHALEASVMPVRAAFARQWPQAVTFDLLDTSLSRDLQHAGHLTPAIIERFIALGSYARYAAGEGGQTQGILFTCSAFGPAIEAVQQSLDIPVLRPNEAAFEAALQIGPRVGLLVSFAPSLPALHAELSLLAQRRGVDIEIVPAIAEGALEALQRGDGAGHDRLVAAAALAMPATDCLILGQFSLARAAAVIAPRLAHPIITTPDSAVAKLQSLLCYPATADGSQVSDDTALA